MNVDLEKIVTPLMPERIIILDWYDGVVSALVQFNNIEQWCLINLEAWDLSRESKVYTLCFLSEKENKDVLKILEEHKPSWPTWITEVPFEFDQSESVIKQSHEHYVFLANDINNGVRSMKRILVNEKYRKADIDGIFNMPMEEKDFWYGLI